MANTAKAADIISKIQRMNTKLISLNFELQEVYERYNDNGGQAFLAPFFLDDQGNPRTDLTVTLAQIVTSVSNQQQLSTLLKNLVATFVQAE